jgi:hypothetical protein
VSGVEIDIKRTLRVTGNEFKLEIKTWIPKIIELLGDKNRTIQETVMKMIKRIEAKG